MKMSKREIFSTVGMMVGLMFGSIGGRLVGLQGIVLLVVMIICAAGFGWLGDQMAQQTEPERTCPSCGTKLDKSDTNFCPKCGQPIPPGFDVKQ